MKVTFIYARAKFVFDVTINFANSDGTFNDPSKRRGYQLNQNDVEMLKVIVEQ